MSSLLYLLSKNAKALHYFILPTLGRLSNQELESQGVDRDWTADQNSVPL